MSKLYVFGIGGTGSRVLKSLTMLLAAGVDCKADTVVPIIIDLDTPGGDVTNNELLIKNYGKVREKITKSFDTKKEQWQNRFFETKIETDNLHLPLTDKGISFRKYVEEPSMETSNKALANVLFSNDNLEMLMKEGFYGNPNIGSVVLNQFEQTKEFQKLCTDIKRDDKIFIISSIFGGTGASGFPLLLKTLRANQNQFVSDAHIGAIAVLPYFNVEPDPNSRVDSATFISKAKAALAYYDRCISKDNGIDALYYIADSQMTTYENHPGGAEQKNKAHFVELAAALSIIDFAASNKEKETIYKEFGIKNKSNKISFDDLGDYTKRLLQKPLIQFLLFAKYLQAKEVDNFKKKPWFQELPQTIEKKPFDETVFKNSDFVKTLIQVQKDFIKWLEELENSNHTRKFSPFELKINDNLMELISGFNFNRGRFGDKFEYSDIDNELNEISKQRKNLPEISAEPQLVELFYRATNILVAKKFRIQ